MATFLFANNAATTLAGPLSNTATTCNVAAGAGALFPQPVSGQFFALTFIDTATKTNREIVYVTNVTGDTLTIVRAQETTAAGTWNTGDIAANLVTAGTLRAFAQLANLASSFYQGTDTSGDPNNMTVTATTPANNAPSAGQVFFITKGSQVNTGNVTLLLPAAGTRQPVLNADGSQIAAGAWPGNASALVTFNGTVYQLVGLLVSPNLLHYGNDTSGTGNQVVASVVPPITTYVQGHRYQVKLTNALTGAGAVANFSGAGNRTIVRADGTPTQANDGVVGQVLDLEDDGTRLQIVGLQTALTQGRLLSVQVFKNHGTFTYTPSAGVRSVQVLVVGAGGAGSGPGTGPTGGNYVIGGGGGGGGYAISNLLIATAGVSGATITVGTGGAGAPNGGGAAANGTSSSFGAFLSATGGMGATAVAPVSGSAVQAGGNGGQGSGGNFDNGPGQPGAFASGNSNLNFVTGSGGGSKVGYGAGAVYSGTYPGISAVIPGAGGGGGASQSGGGGMQPGGSGADGYVEIREYT